MRTTELRVGNWVKHNYYKKGGEFDYSREKQIVPNDIPANEKYPENNEPIILTKEWLIKFGFELVNGYGYKKLYFKMLATKVGDSIGFHLRHHLINVEIQYVHQLQNLYFILMGKELEIKESKSDASKD